MPPITASFQFDYPAPACTLSRDGVQMAEICPPGGDIFELAGAVVRWIKASGHDRQIILTGDASGRCRSQETGLSCWEVIEHTMKLTGLEILSQYPKVNTPVLTEV